MVEGAFQRNGLALVEIKEGIIQIAKQDIVLHFFFPFPKPRRSSALGEATE